MPASAAHSASVLESLSDDLASATERAGQSVVAIHARRRIPSSGVLWRPGVVVTAQHTIRRDEEITVTLADGATVGATLVGRDPSTDLGVLRLADSAGAVAEPSPDEARVGRLVLALGRPGPSVTAAFGIISAVGGEWRTWSGGRIDRFIRLDLAIYEGFSGGALTDVRGRLLGINSSGLARASAMTIPLATVQRVADQLLASGRVRRGYFGVALQPVRIPPALRQEQSLPRDAGLMAVSVEDNGPAQRAGILLGDILVSFDGVPVSDPAELLALLSGERIGAPVNVRLIRAGRVMDVQVTIAERSARGHGK